MFTMAFERPSKSYIKKYKIENFGNVPVPDLMLNNTQARAASKEALGVLEAENMVSFTFRSKVFLNLTNENGDIINFAGISISGKNIGGIPIRRIYLNI